MDKELATLAAQLGIDDPEKLQALQDLIDWIVRQVKQQIVLDFRTGK